ncbi:hypothetical protein OSTOST_18391 [Ostertagia ostertagi]
MRVSPFKRLREETVFVARLVLVKEPLPNAVMLLQDSALVVKKKSASTLLLIVKKRWVVGNFFSCDVPPVGAVIAITWRNARAQDTIDISGWNHHMEPMGGFLVNESGGVIKGMR